MADLERLTDLELVPVVELPAWSYSERPLPEGPSRNHREAWLRYWLECLADAGITGLRPIEPGSMHVAVNAFTDLGSLVQVVARLVEPEALTSTDGPGALSGGFAITAGGRALVARAAVVISRTGASGRPPHSTASRRGEYSGSGTRGFRFARGRRRPGFQHATRIGRADAGLDSRPELDRPSARECHDRT